MILPSEALAAQVKGKNVLIFRPYGVSINHFAVEQAICGQLGLLGAKVNWLICNGIFSECDRHWQLINRNDKKDACQRCVGFAVHIRNQFKLAMAGLGEHLTQADYTYVDDWLAALHPSELSAAELEGWQLGEWSMSSVNTHLRCAQILLDDPAHVVAYRAYLRSAALTAVAFRNYLAKSPVDALFLMNGRTAASRTVYEIARSRGIPVAVHEFGRSEETRFLFLNETCLSMRGWNQHWEAWKDIPLTRSEVGEIQGLISARLKGKVDYSYNKDNKVSVKNLLSDIQGKKIVSLFTSSMDEISSSVDWEWPYTQIEWMAEVIKYFKDRPEYMLVIRCHPNHDNSFFGKDFQFLDALLHLGYQGCDNIRVVMPTEKVDSYDLLQSSSAVLVFVSTVAIESSLLGIKTMIAGSGRNQGRQLAYEYTDANLANVAPTLTEFLENPVDEQWRINAARWYYIFTFRYVYDVPLVKREEGRLECRPEAFTTLLPQWQLLNDIVRFFCEGDGFVQRLPEALSDTRNYEQERREVAEAFDVLARRQQPARILPDAAGGGRTSGILVLDPDGDAKRLEYTLENIFSQIGAGALVVVLSTLSPVEFFEARGAELIFVQADAYQGTLQKISERGLVRWTMLLRAGDSVELAPKQYDDALLVDV